MSHIEDKEALLDEIESLLEHAYTLPDHQIEQRTEIDWQLLQLCRDISNLSSGPPPYWSDEVSMSEAASASLLALLPDAEPTDDEPTRNEEPVAQAELIEPSEAPLPQKAPAFAEPDAPEEAPEWLEHEIEKVLDNVREWEEMIRHQDAFILRLRTDPNTTQGQLDHHQQRLALTKAIYKAERKKLGRLQGQLA